MTESLTTTNKEQPVTSGDTAIAAFSTDGNFTTAQRMAKALAASTLVPKAYQNNIPNVLIAIELANRVGCSVLMCMQQLDIIHERPSWRSQFLIATVNSCGRFEPMDFQFQGEEGSDAWGCRAIAVEKASGKERRGPLVTIGTAKAEGWYARNGSKWKTLPELMLMYRSAAFWTRVYAPELSLGMHTTEELADMGPTIDITPAQEPESRTELLLEKLGGASFTVTPAGSDGVVIDAAARRPSGEYEAAIADMDEPAGAAKAPAHEASVLTREELVEEIRALLKQHGKTGPARDEALQSAFGDGSWIRVCKLDAEALAVGLRALQANLAGLASMRAERQPGEDPEEN